MKTLMVLIFLGFSFILFAQNEASQNKHFIIGIKTGAFIPSDQQIKGSDEIDILNSGSVSGIFMNGFGIGGNFLLTANYFFSNVGVNIESGLQLLKQKEGASIYPSGNYEYYENTLTIFPIEAGIKYKFSSNETEIEPYFGIGAGLYFENVETKYTPEQGQRRWGKDKFAAFGCNINGGFFIPLYSMILANIEMKYNFAVGNMNLKNVDDSSIQNYKNINTGGLSINIGIALKL